MSLPDCAQISVVINLVVFALYQQKLSVLLVERNKMPFLDQWALPTFYIDVDQDSDLESAIQRQLIPLTGKMPPYVEQVQTVGNRSRDPRRWSISIVYYLMVPSLTLAAHQRLMPLTRLKPPLAFDHHQLIKNCLSRLQSKSLYTSLPIFLLPQEFTLTDVQKAYETVLDFKIEKKSFRRRLLDAGFLQETGNIRRASHRPALLYRLTQMQPYYFARIMQGRESKQ